MILVDTSVWVAHLRGRRTAVGLPPLLRAGQVCMHPWVLGELVLGGVASTVRSRLEAMARLPCASDEVLLGLIDQERLAGTGIGWLDAGLLASARAAGASLWTLDRALLTAARVAGVCGVR